MILEEQLRDAHFWGKWICLDCGQTEEDPPGEDEGTNCPTCGSVYFASAYEFRMILNRVKRDEEEKDE